MVLADLEDALEQIRGVDAACADLAKDLALVHHEKESVRCAGLGRGSGLPDLGLVGAGAGHGQSATSNRTHGATHISIIPAGTQRYREVSLEPATGDSVALEELVGVGADEVDLRQAEVHREVQHDRVIDRSRERNQQALVIDQVSDPVGVGVEHLGARSERHRTQAFRREVLHDLARVVDAGDVLTSKGILAHLSPVELVE